ncbi:MAG: hypothetical protein WCF57_00610 [Pyrinomonadaceae bacterium]
MRTFAQKLKQPQTPSPLNSVRSGLVNHAAVHQIGPGPQLQRTVENRTGKLARKAESESRSAAPATSSFAYDFSRIPVHAQEPATVSDETNASGDMSSSQADCPPGKTNVPLWFPGRHIMPEFLPLSAIKHEPERTTILNPDKPSITVPWRAPTVVGQVAADCKAKVWRYQLKSFFSGGDMWIVYYNEEHYPAPGPPTDDTGPLTNVTKKNWKEIVAQLEEGKDSYAKFWDSYKSQDLHEEYHWNVHWKGVVYEMLPKLEQVIETLRVPFTHIPGLQPKPVTASEAEAILEPRMQTHLSVAYKVALASYQAIPDKPGDTAYKAQIPAFKFLIKRVKEYAKTKGWLSASPQQSK